jgi:hypothetical protein
MTAVAFAMADHRPARDGSGGGTISISKALGGCGESHEVQTDDRGHPYYECDRCAPALIGHCYGFAAHPGGVPLTPDELADREAAERDAKASQSFILQSMTDAFVKNLAAGAPLAIPQPKSLADQVAGMSEDDKAALRELLGGPAKPSKSSRASSAAKD